MTIARLKISTPDKLEATMTVSMTVADWRKVHAALEKGRDGWYGPETTFLDAVDGVLKQVDQTYYAQSPAEPA